MRVVIPSRGRSDTIVLHTLKWFPNAIICVEDSEAEDYGDIGADLLLHPKLPGLPAIINWILACPDLAGSRLAIVDDDLKAVFSIIGEKSRPIEGPSDIMAIVENCCAMAEGFGAKLWGFSVNRRPDSNYAYKPFSLSARISSFRGVSDRNMRLDESFLRHDDADLSLIQLLENRVVFRDDRFNFIFQPIYSTPGGSADTYRETSWRDEQARLKQKWGKYVYFVRSPHHWKETRINVRR